MATEPSPIRTRKKVSCNLRELLLDDDYERVCSLLSNHGLRAEPKDEWKHLWLDNPAYLPIKGRWPAGWILEDQDRNAVGYLGNIPLRYELNGRTLLCATPRAWVVSEAFRGYSFLLLDSFFSQRLPDLFISTTANDAGSIGIREFGATPTPRSSSGESLFWIGNATGFVRSWLEWKSVPAARALSVPLGVLVNLRERVNWLPRPQQVCVETAETFDGRFDQFWERLKARNPHLLFCDRSSESLTWHFQHQIAAGAVWVFTVHRRGEMLGYSIFRRLDNRQIGLKRMYLVDFQLTGDTSLLLPMLREALRKCRKDGIHMLEIGGWGISDDERITKVAPHVRHTPPSRFFYKSNRPDLGIQLNEASRWMPSLYDGDSSF